MNLFQLYSNYPAASCEEFFRLKQWAKPLRALMAKGESHEIVDDLYTRYFKAAHEHLNEYTYAKLRDKFGVSDSAYLMKYCDPDPQNTTRLTAAPEMTRLVINMVTDGLGFVSPEQFTDLTEDLTQPE